ncbi:MarC family protein, partial [Enterococcus faecium]|nr:MarC family protein [Enterococcus faecium]
GNNIMNVITKLMGLILATIGVRMLIMGVQVAFHW